MATSRHKALLPHTAPARATALMTPHPLSLATAVG